MGQPYRERWSYKEVVDLLAYSTKNEPLTPDTEITAVTFFESAPDFDTLSGRGGAEHEIVVWLYRRMIFEQFLAPIRIVICAGSSPNDVPYRKINSKEKEMNE